MMRSSLVSICQRVIQTKCKNGFSQIKFRQLSSAIAMEENYEGENHSVDVKVQVTKTLSSQSNDPQSVENPLRSSDSPYSVASDDTALVDSLLTYTSSLVEKSDSNIIAFSGGVDSSLAAALVHRIFHTGIESMGNLKAVIGVSNSLPQRQLDLARLVASKIDIDLMEVRTTEGDDANYVANQGNACFVCKNHLYSALEAVANTASEISLNDRKQKVALFNGTNADDTKDPTRLGLLSAKSFSVRSPLMNISKDEVRRAARHLDLPNWNYAASPCLRSRLAIGVEATENHLIAVNKAEERVRTVLALDETVNLRVRMLSGNRAMVELDTRLIDARHESPETLLRNEGFEEFCRDLGFHGGIGVRPFKTGSVSVKKQ
jgi:uncharacterized protein